MSNILSEHVYTQLLAQSTDEAPLDLIVYENDCGQTLNLNVFIIFLYKRFVKCVVAYRSL